MHTLIPWPTKPVAKRPDTHAERIKISSPFVGGVGPAEVLTTMIDLGQRMAANPWPVAAETANLARELRQIWAGRSERKPQKGDRRFADAAWKDNPAYHCLSQAYLAWAETVSHAIQLTGGDDREIQRAQYVAALFTDALCPANTLVGNPVALAKAVETHGASLVAGMRNALHDLVDNDGLPAQVDKAAFRVGQNLATTPGSVVYRNEVLELIQYTPTTAKVFSRPVMLVPPIVNKFYLLDLAPGKSMVEYLVAQGFQTFIVSWRNPTEACAEWGLDTYVTALLSALAAIAHITGQPDLNIYTVCTGIGPTAALLGHLAARKLDRVHSLTAIVSVMDSNDGGSLGLFATPESLVTAQEKSAEAGVLGGNDMAKVFTWMRPNDLVWPCWINNYLLGNSPPAFDLLYWSNDSIRLAAKLHAQMLDIYGRDMLSQPGGLSVLGTPITLGQVTCDSYMVGGRTDHISVWKGVYNSGRMLGGQFDFVLQSGGHIQAVVCPPKNAKGHYHVSADGPAPAAPQPDPDEWLATAHLVPGSWWPHWRDWLAQRSGAQRPAPTELGSPHLQPLCPAPGTYVLEE